MNDTLLTSLCKICHIEAPKYTCPRCLAETCSLTCSKRHKLWASCNGVRDPTVYRPISEVATPSGIDHDYNFIHSIEHRISRSEKVLIEDLGLVSRDELKRARMGEDEESSRKKPRANNEAPGEVCIRKVLEDHSITVIKAPKGMRRNRENTTTWSRKRKTIDWQVEWLREGPAGRTLYKVSGGKPIGDQYDMLCDEERRMSMTDEGKREAKKRKTQELKVRAAKRRAFHPDARLNLPAPALQDPATGTWRLELSSFESPENPPECFAQEAAPRNYHLYIHRPLTPASFPKVIANLDLSKPLTELLAHRNLLEYPTIYVLEQDPLHLPSGFMLESDYLMATGGEATGNNEESSSFSESTDSSSSSSSDEETEGVGDK